MKFKRVHSMAQPVLHCFLPSMTRQEFQHDADMNVIVDRFLRTGVLDQPNACRPCVDGLEMPGDFTEASNFAFDELNQQSGNSDVGSDQKPNETNNENGGSENENQGNVGSNKPSTPENLDGVV